MNSHPEELELARAYRRDQPFEQLTQQQIDQIMDRGRSLYKWFKTHKILHCGIGLAVFVFLLGGDFHAYFAPGRHPRQLARPRGDQ